MHRVCALDTSRQGVGTNNSDPHAPDIVQALSLVDLYAERDVTPERLYIKLASTWEGIRACEALEKQGIQCNLTLLFSFAQARAHELQTFCP